MWSSRIRCSSGTNGLRFSFDLVPPAWAILPASILWGASFPLALAGRPRRAHAGRMVWRVYAATPSGDRRFDRIRLWIIPKIGTQNLSGSSLSFSA